MSDRWMEVKHILIEAQNMRIGTCRDACRGSEWEDRAVTVSFRNRR